MADTNINPIARDIVESYMDDEKTLALILAVNYWGMVGQNPKTTPATEGKLFDTANKFHRWLME